MSTRLGRIGLSTGRGFPLLGWISRMRALARQRHDLGRLDARMLDDIGLDARTARRESDRPPWDAPSHWFD